MADLILSSLNKKINVQRIATINLTTEVCATFTICIDRLVAAPFALQIQRFMFAASFKHKNTVLFFFTQRKRDNSNVWKLIRVWQ